MAILYKHFAALRTVFYAFFFAVVLALSFPPASGHASTLFTIEDVEVDVTAANAAAARKQAFAQAQVTAFEELSRRMVAEGEGLFLSPPEPSVISSLIKDFEITEEKLSRVRYIGTYTFRFEKEAVREFFSGQGLGYTDVSSRPVMVLPYYQGADRPVLWQGENPFNAAWNAAKNLSGIVPIVVPLGDISDVRDLGNGDALAFDVDGVNNMITRYNAGEAIILLAIPDARLASVISDEDTAQGGLTVHMYRTDRGLPEHAGRVDIEASGVETRAVLYRRAVESVQQAIQRNWKSRTVVNAAQGNRLQVKVRFGNLSEWAETQSQLERVQGINDVSLVKLARDHAIVDITFQGAERRLRLSLAQADMTLTKPRIGFDLAAGGGSPLLYELYLNRYRPAPAPAHTQNTRNTRNTRNYTLTPAPETQEPETQEPAMDQRAAEPKRGSGWKDWF